MVAVDEEAEVVHLVAGVMAVAATNEVEVGTKTAVGLTSRIVNIMKGMLKLRCRSAGRWRGLEGLRKSGVGRTRGGLEESGLDKTQKSWREGKKWSGRGETKRRGLGGQKEGK